MAILSIEQELAIQRFQESGLYNHKTNIAQVARDLNVPYHILRHRLHGRKSKLGNQPGNKKIKKHVDTVLCAFIDRLIAMHCSPSRRLLLSTANYILRQGDPAVVDNPTATPQPTLSQSWVKRWLDRHPQYDIKKQKPKEIKRHLAEQYREGIAQ